MSELSEKQQRLVHSWDTCPISELSQKQQRLVARETSILLAALVVEHGLSFDAAVSSVKAALDAAYWGDMDDHYQGAIVPVPTGGGNDAH